MWTKQQQKAIDTRDCDLLVSAAAGSGKTAVLVERIITMITEGKNPIDVDKLLVVTFTKAAASEMSQRIGEAIAKKLENDPTNEHLQNQLTHLNRADIKTIHSFCLQVVKENYYALDIDPAVKTADEIEVRLLQQEVIEELFEELYEAEENEMFCKLVELFGNDTKDTKLKELVLDIHEFLLGCPQPLKWLDEMTEAFAMKNDTKIEDTPWAESIRQNIKENIAMMRYYLQQGKILAENTEGFEKYAIQLNMDCEMAENYKNIHSLPFRHAKKQLQQIYFEKMPSYRGEEKEIAKQIQEFRKKAKQSIAHIQEELFPYCIDRMEEHIKKLYPIVKALADVVELFIQRYQSVKKEKRILDFGDYEHFCMKVLLQEGSTPQNILPTEAALELQKKYDEVLIDEYQDSNMIQEMILSAVSKKSQGKHNRFMVGDVKQSIYRFRLAMPEIFMKKYYDYTLEQGEEQKILLSQNFRSRKNILDGINFIFRQIMSQKVGGLAYDDEAALYAGALFPMFDGNCGGENEVILLDTKTTQQENIEQSTENTIIEWGRREQEALLIAKRIKKMIVEEKYHILDKKTGFYRPVAFEDIAILLRSTKSWEGVFDNVFIKEDIPFYAESSLGYFDTLEVMTISNLLCVLDNPIQDIPLLSLLHSPIYGFTAEELMQIRMTAEKDANYYECILYCLQNYGKNAENSPLEETEDIRKITEKLEKFMSDITLWRKKAKDCSISQLLWYLYGQTGYFDYVGVTAGGKLRQANLRFLIQKAEEYEKSSLKGLFHFVRYIENIKKAKDDGAGSAKLLNENENMVRIMTIHKSKGLEFPVVFVADMAKEFNTKDLQKKVLLDHQIGIGLNYMDLEQRVSYTTLPKKALEQKIKQENISEEMRVLYVAMTRAKEKMILTGCVKDIEKKVKDWLSVASAKEKTLPVYKMAQAKNYLDWVMPALLRHKAGKRFLEQFDVSLDYAYFLEDSSQWNMILEKENKQQIQETEENQQQQEVKQYFENWDNQKDYSGKRDAVFYQLNWEYENKIATKLQSNISISEIKRKWQEAEGIFEQQQHWKKELELPKFEKEEKKLTASEIGTATHTFMEQVDITKKYSLEEVKQKIKELAKKNILSQKEAEALRYDEIAMFFESSLAKRIRNASYVQKEKGFSMLIEAKEIFAQKEYENIKDTVVIHGIIDCFFEEEGEIVLVDYKNDRIWGEKNADTLKEQYKIQMYFYKKALEKSTGKKVKEVYLYSFALGEAIAMT